MEAKLRIDFYVEDPPTFWIAMIYPRAYSLRTFIPIPKRQATKQIEVVDSSADMVQPEAYERQTTAYPNHFAR